MNVYFACSIRGGGDTSNYLTIIDAIKNAGATLLSEVFVHDAIQYGGSPLPVEEIYQRDISMIQDADIVIAEVTNPSLGVGYELAYAESLHKPVLCLFNANTDRKLSAMIAGNSYNRIETYTHDTLAMIITQFIHR
ncbi:MAG TPA: nucleoside 2-deoxyribosyltransferase [Candidatus Saccharibacteria bacterium]|nr:nucleoside 2-deoxyribosyltransferase [Candidatus Saccharibacteria bacterium]